MTEYPAGPQDTPGPVPPQPYAQPYAAPSGQPSSVQPYAPQPYPAQPYQAQPFAPQPFAPQPYAVQPYAPQPTWGPPPGHAAPGAYAAYADPGAPYGRDPLTGLPLSDKSKVAAGLLQLFLGTFGVGRFYTGHVGIAVGQLVLTLAGFVLTFVGVGILLLWGAGIWAFVDAIVLLAGRPTDAQGLVLRS